MWQQVEKALPQQGVEVLTWSPTMGYGLAWLNEEMRWDWGGVWTASLNKVSCWHPLPSPPEEMR